MALKNWQVSSNESCQHFDPDPLSMLMLIPDPDPGFSYKICIQSSSNWTAENNFICLVLLKFL
jgi:hypothetical protein